MFATFLLMVFMIWTLQAQKQSLLYRILHIDNSITLGEPYSKNHALKNTYDASLLPAYLHVFNGKVGKYANMSNPSIVDSMFEAYSSLNKYNRKEKLNAKALIYFIHHLSLITNEIPLIFSDMVHDLDQMIKGGYPNQYYQNQFLREKNLVNGNNINYMAFIKLWRDKLCQKSDYGNFKKMRDVHYIFIESVLKNLSDDTSAKERDKFVLSSISKHCEYSEDQLDIYDNIAQIDPQEDILEILSSVNSKTPLSEQVSTNLPINEVYVSVENVTNQVEEFLNKAMNSSDIENLIDGSKVVEVKIDSDGNVVIEQNLDENHQMVQEPQIEDPIEGNEINDQLPNDEVNQGYFGNFAGHMANNARNLWDNHLSPMIYGQEVDDLNIDKETLESYVSKHNSSSLNYMLGTIYESGRKEMGISKNLTMAKYHFEIAGELGHKDAYLSLALIVMNDDFTKAVEYFEKWALIKNGEWVYYLAFLYKDGIGVDKNITYALEKIEQAIFLNNTNVIDLLDDLYLDDQVTDEKYEFLIETAMNLSGEDELKRYMLEVYKDRGKLHKIRKWDLLNSLFINFAITEN